MDQSKLRKILFNISHEYPSNMVQGQLRDIPRIAFHINLVIEGVKGNNVKGLSICDVGGGIGLFSLGCAAIGFKRVTLIDDFNDAVNKQVGDSIFSLHWKYGVEVISRDIIAHSIGDVCNDFDVVTTFDSMEHWHHSPRRLFGEIILGLRPGGIFILGAPNCVNMRKRLTVPLGMGKWSSMQEWYNSDVFRGHVREPDVEDLSYIARDMNLVEIKIIGRNWMGYFSNSKYIRMATQLTGRILTMFPSLCSDIYLVGKKSIS